MAEQDIIPRLMNHNYMIFILNGMKVSLIINVGIL